MRRASGKIKSEGFSQHTPKISSFRAMKAILTRKMCKNISGKLKWKVVNQF